MSSAKDSIIMDCGVSRDLVELSELIEYYINHLISAVLSLYLTSKLNFEETQATVMYHIFTSLVYFFPILGAIIADSWLGKFKYGILQD